MRFFGAILVVMLLSADGWCQATFKCGWTTYKTAFIDHEYTYNCVLKDSVKLYLQDSTTTFVTADSAVAYTIDHPILDKSIYRTAKYFNKEKLLVKTEDYKDNNLQVITDFKYDDKKRKNYQFEDNKLSGNNYKKIYEYVVDKQSGDDMVCEVAYENGRVEFYTKSYFNKQKQKYKEIRLNDNNKDVVHIENFTYNASGKLKERKVYFPEFKVTKTFPENVSDDPATCSRTLPVNIADKFSPSSKVGYAKKLLQKNLPLLMDPACHDFAYRFKSKDCEVKIVTTKVNNIKQVTVTYREKI